MGWTDMPPSGDQNVTDFQWVRQFLEAIRERRCILNQDTRWPFSTFPWEQGYIKYSDEYGDGVVDNGDGTLRINCRYWDDDANDYLSFDWIDGSSIRRWTSFSGTFNGNDLSPYAPSSYKICIYPIDGGSRTASHSATDLADPTTGFVYNILDNGEDWVKITNDGRITLNADLDDLGGGDGIQWGFQIIRQGSEGGFGAGFGWTDRYPQRPNSQNSERDYGIICSSTTTTITDTHDGDEYGSDFEWHTPKAWTVNQWADHEVVFQVADVWTRTAITSNTANTLTFAAQSVAPTGEYWIIEGPDEYGPKWWRPEGRLILDHVLTNSGYQYIRQSHEPWNPLAWYQTFSNILTQSHDPKDDVLRDFDTPASTETVHECESEDCNCEAEGEHEIEVFDNDARSLIINYCPGYADWMFNPYMYRTLRGLQTGIEDLVDSFIEPRDYAGFCGTSIPPFTQASWWLYHNSTNTRNAIIGTTDDTSSVDFDTAISDMPEQTPQFGPHTTLECTWTVFDDCGVPIDSGTGIASSTALVRTDEDSEGNPLTFGAAHEGHGVTISFGWTRRYERRFVRLYERTVFIPDEHDGGPVFPPTDKYPGAFETEQPSTNYAEFTQYGRLEEDGPVFVDGEAARYCAQNFDDPWPRSDSQFEDAKYQGIPNIQSDFPKWSKRGTATGGGTFYLEDAGQNWWVNSSGLTISGTATSGSTTTVGDTALYKIWDVAEGVTRLPTFMTGANADRQVGMVIEVETSTDVWEPRIITAVNIATPSAPVFTFAPALSVTASGKAYRIAEPKGSTSFGAVRDLWRTRTLRVFSGEYGGYTDVQITRSDNTRIFFADGELGHAIESGTAYEIIEVAPGAVMQWHDGDYFTGWITMDDELVVQDDRGEDWHTGGYKQWRQNLPTMVKHFGRLRKFDAVGNQLWHDLYTGLDALRWTKASGTWHSRESDDTPENNRKGATGPEEELRPIPPDDSPQRAAVDTDFSASDYELDGARPQGWTDCFAHEEFGQHTKEAFYSWLQPEAPPVCLRCQIDFFLFSGGVTEENITTFPKSTITYDDNGTGYGKDTWNNFGTCASDAITRKKGGNKTANWGRLEDIYDISAVFDPTPYTDRVFNGYFVVTEATIRKWDVTNGLTYCSPP